MKNLNNYILEKLVIGNNLDASGNLYIPNNIYKILINLTKNINYSDLEIVDYYKDPNKFNIYENNSKLFIDNINSDKYIALNTREYYNITVNNSWSTLSDKEKTDFHDKYGDIIITDKNYNVICYISLNICDKYAGSISLNSFINFNENGYYICISKNNNQIIFIPHAALEDIIKQNQKDLLYQKTNRGYSIKWNNQELNSEYFIPVNKLFKYF